ncbi:MAG: hypothetical protein KDD44_02835, partial [Bdellovibrionales bacterium]|nr:hypothetical protein [Bdellovibrionales bacterium]
VAARNDWRVGVLTHDLHADRRFVDLPTSEFELLFRAQGKAVGWLFAEREQHSGAVPENR